MTAGQRIVLYDGVCGLCDHFVQFLLKADTHRLLTYATLQGETAARVRARHSGDLQGVDSVVYVQDWNTPSERVWIKSDAVWNIGNDMGGIWRVVALFRVIPKALRDWGYDQVARNRYSLFGQY